MIEKRGNSHFSSFQQPSSFEQADRYGGMLIRKFLATPFAVGLSAFLMVFFLGVQMKNLQHNEILLAGLTSVGISSLWLINVNGAMRNGACKAAYVVGASLGAMSAIPFYGLLSS